MKNTCPLTVLNCIQDILVKLGDAKSSGGHHQWFSKRLKGINELRDNQQIINYGQKIVQTTQKNRDLHLLRTCSRLKTDIFHKFVYNFTFILPDNAWSQCLNNLKLWNNRIHTRNVWIRLFRVFISRNVFPPRNWIAKNQKFLTIWSAQVWRLCATLVCR